MARFCYFWRISPDEFWDLDVEEYFAMLRHMRRVQQQHDNASSGRNRLRGRG